MGNRVKIHEHSFNRGVNDVLTLKPVRKAFGVMVHTVSSGSKKSAAMSVSKGGKFVERTNHTRQR